MIKDDKFIKQFLINLAKTKVDVDDYRQCYFDLLAFKNASKIILMNMEGIGGNVDDYKI